MIASRRYRYSRRALRDLVQIYKFVAKTDIIAADRLIEGIRRKVASIAKTGYTGVPRDEFAPGLRAFIFKNHCIYFQVTASHLHVIRILHGRQDISSENFFESEN